MALTKIEGSLVAFQISTNLVTPAWKNIVCAEDAALDGSSDVTTRKTKCGTISTASPADWTMTGSGVANATPDTGDISAEEIIELFQDHTPVLARMVYASDTSVYLRKMAGSFSAYGETAGVGEPVAFTYTFKGDGVLETTE